MPPPEAALRLCTTTRVYCHSPPLPYNFSYRVSRRRAPERWRGEPWIEKTLGVRVEELRRRVVCHANTSDATLEREYIMDAVLAASGECDALARALAQEALNRTQVRYHYEDHCCECGVDHFCLADAPLLGEFEWARFTLDSLLFYLPLLLILAPCLGCPAYVALLRALESPLGARLLAAAAAARKAHTALPL